MTEAQDGCRARSAFPLGAGEGGLQLQGHAQFTQIVYSEK